MDNDQPVTYDAHAMVNNEVHVSAPLNGETLSLFQWRGHGTSVDLIACFTKYARLPLVPLVRATCQRADRLARVLTVALRWMAVPMAHSGATVLGSQFELSVFLAPGAYRSADR